MRTPVASRQLVLLVIARPLAVAAALDDQGFDVLLALSGSLALELAFDTQPDLVVIEENLPDMAGLELCRRLRRSHPQLQSVPVLMLLNGKPGPDQKVAALRAGVWDFLRTPYDSATLRDFCLKISTYSEAKRDLEIMHPGGLLDVAAGIYTQAAFARRVRELGALMARTRGAISCIVFETEGGGPDPLVNKTVSQAARESDVVGELSKSRVGVFAPATDEQGVVMFAERVASSLRKTRDERSRVAGATAPRLLAGYEAVSNAMYAPTDPLLLLVHAAHAVHLGLPDARHDWMRRFNTEAPVDASHYVESPVALTLTDYTKRRELR